MRLSSSHQLSPFAEAFRITLILVDIAMSIMLGFAVAAVALDDENSDLLRLGFASLTGSFFLLRFFSGASEKHGLNNLQVLDVRVKMLEESLDAANMELDDLKIEVQNSNVAAERNAKRITDISEKFNTMIVNTRKEIQEASDGDHGESADSLASLTTRHGNLTRFVENLNQELSELTQKVANIESGSGEEEPESQSNVLSEISAIKSSIASVKTSVKQCDGRIASATSRINGIQSDIDRINRKLIKKVDDEEVRRSAVTFTEKLIEAMKVAKDTALKADDLADSDDDGEDGGQ